MDLDRVVICKICDREIELDSPSAIVTDSPMKRSEVVGDSLPQKHYAKFNRRLSRQANFYPDAHRAQIDGLDRH